MSKNNNSLIRHLKYYRVGRKLQTNEHHLEGIRRTKSEKEKKPNRIEILNLLISTFDRETYYLEIGVRNPNNTFNHISATKKYSVDPGLEYEDNPVDFKMTSDTFFLRLRSGEILYPNVRFDVVFIDGLHFAEQVDQDIFNSFEFLQSDGFIVLHDCNPPTEWHAREEYQYKLSPAGGNWNGTTWKAFLKWRFNMNVQSCCIDTDWGVGILSKTHPIGSGIEQTNAFYENYILEENRKKHLNLIDFDELKVRLAVR